MPPRSPHDTGSHGQGRNNSTSCHTVTITCRGFSPSDLTLDPGRGRGEHRGNRDSEPLEKGTSSQDTGESGAGQRGEAGGQGHCWALPRRVRVDPRLGPVRAAAWPISLRMSPRAADGGLQQPLEEAGPARCWLPALEGGRLCRRRPSSPWEARSGGAPSKQRPVLVCGQPSGSGR